MISNFELKCSMEIMLQGRWLKHCSWEIVQNITWWYEIRSRVVGYLSTTKEGCGAYHRFAVRTFLRNVFVGGGGVFIVFGCYCCCFIVCSKPGLRWKILERQISNKIGINPHQDVFPKGACGYLRLKRKKNMIIRNRAWKIGNVLLYEFWFIFFSHSEFLNHSCLHK